MNVSLPDLLKKSYLRKNVLFREFKSLRSHKTKTLIEKSETKLFQLFFTYSEKNILVDHIFSLCPINGKRQIFNNFFSKSAFDLWTKCRRYIIFLKEHFIIYLLIYKLVINFIKMCNLFALENLKILRKMLKIAKSKKFKDP